MEASLSLRPAVRGAFAHLIDYAGLFPPAALAPVQASEEYRSARAGAHAWMLGRFIAPLRAAGSFSDLPGVPFSAILDARDDEGWQRRVAAELADAAALRRAGVRIEALEVPLPAALCAPGALEPALRHLRTALTDAALPQLGVFVELSRDGAWAQRLPAAMAHFARYGMGAKLRCGGVSAAAFPGIGEVAAFVAAAAEHGVAFKATAGLHHPVRRSDPATGATMHGFLNLLAAAALAPLRDEALLREVLAEEYPGAWHFEPDALRWREHRIGAAQLEATRRDAFLSYGSCSFAEPVDDLRALEILS